jgi:hypothetical protein
VSKPAGRAAAIGSRYVSRSSSARARSSPTHRAELALAALADHANALGLTPEVWNATLRELLGGAFADASGDDFVGQLTEQLDGFTAALMEQPNGNEAAKAAQDPRWHALFAGLAFALDALKADRTGRTAEAWDLAADAVSWEALLSGLLAGGDPALAEAAVRAREGASRGGKRSAETRRAQAVDKQALIEAATKFGWPEKKGAPGALAGKERFKGVGKSRITTILREELERRRQLAK